jgi:hypothetical protein
MATELTKTMDDATDQVVALIEKVQESAASAVAAVSEAVATYVPELGLGEVLLSPTDVVNSSYRSGNKFVDAGHKAALGMVEAVSPITDKLFGSKSKPAPKAVAKSA